MNPASLLRSISGHVLTITPAIRDRVRQRRAPGRRWSLRVEDPRVGPVTLSGLLSEAPHPRGLLVVLHGLGGNPERGYCADAANAAARAGLSCLRLALRGSFGPGDDIYHAGLFEDVASALASPELRRHPHVFLLGYSLGGHIALRAAAERVDPRLRAVATVCAPIDLAAAADAIDAPGAWLYRRHVLAGINAHYREVARRYPGRVPTPVEIVERVRSLRARDAVTVCPRFGFQGADDYYRRASVRGRLAAIEVPTVMVAATHDPMIPAASLRAALPGAAPATRMVWVSLAGHLYFPGGVDLGAVGPRGLEDQLLGWMLERAGLRPRWAPAVTRERVA